PLHRDVVGEVPALERPDREEVGLELGDEVDGGLHPVPVLLALELLGPGPEDVCRDAAGPAEQGELEHEAAGVDLADRSLAEVLAPLLLVEPVRVGDQGPEDADDQQQVDDLPIEVRSHAATSRFFRMKYPAMENGKA